jgi:hypothetical protein
VRAENYVSLGTAKDNFCELFNVEMKLNSQSISLKSFFYRQKSQMLPTNPNSLCLSIKCKFLVEILPYVRIIILKLFCLFMRLKQGRIYHERGSGEFNN